MDLSVIILNWNARNYLEKSLTSLVCAPQHLDFEVLVVDNASEDDSAAMVREKFPGVALIENQENTGFGAGNNLAAPKTSGRYILFLNPDTVVMEGALAAMVAYADANPDIGILGPKLLNGDGSLQYSCRRFPNLATGFFRNTPLGRLLPKNRFASDYLMKDFDHAAPLDVDWVSGAALMLRRELFNQIGAFDEDFFMYCEDVDICLRAGKAQMPNGKNWRVTYFPDSVIYHLIGKSSDLVPTRMTYEFHRSQHLFYKKHYAATTPFFPAPADSHRHLASRRPDNCSATRLLYWKKRLRGEIRRKGVGG